MIGKAIHAIHLKSLLKQYGTTSNQVLRDYHIKLISDYIKGSTGIVSVLVRHEGQDSASETLAEIEFSPKHFAERVEMLIGYLEKEPDL